MDPQKDLNTIIELAERVKKVFPQQLTLKGELIKEIGIAKEVTAMVLDKFEECRNDDNLFFESCEEIYRLNNLPYSKKTQETWRRARQYFQAKGWWEARPEVKEARMAKAKLWGEMWK